MLKKYDIKIDGEFPVNVIYQFNPPLTANFRTVEGYKVYKEVMKEIVKRYDGIIHENGYSLLDEVNKLEDGVLYNDKEEIHNLIIWDENGKWVMDYNLDLRPEGNPFRRYKGRDYSTKGENGWDLIMPNFDSSEIFSSLYERKNLIRKILKEEQDEFEWARGFDTKEVEKQIQKKFYASEDNFSFDGPKLYQMLVHSGINNIDKLIDIGDFLYDEVTSVYEKGREAGYEDYNCDGCCDDYIYYDDHRDAVNDAKEAGDEDGYERGREESESEINELKSRIEELESQLNETVNKKNTKRI